MTNISKNRKFTDNFYEIYELEKKQIGNFLNTWFVGKVIHFSDLEKNKTKLKRGELNNYLIRDEMWTVKKTDEETSSRLYHRKINPISIVICCPLGGKFSQNDSGEDLYEMKATIHSVDDSSFGIWFDSKTFNDLKDIRIKLMEFINAFPEINGEMFLEVCVESGADEESIDYN